MGLQCTKCLYVSRRYNLYEEVETKSPGRKAATVNYVLQVGLSQTPIGNDGMRKILLSINTTPPTRKSLQKTSNKIMPIIENLNEADMSNRCRQLVDVNTLRGSDSPLPSPYSAMACTITPCTRGWVRHPSSRRHRLCTHSLKMLHQNIR